MLSDRIGYAFAALFSAFLGTPSALAQTGDPAIDAPDLEGLLKPYGYAEFGGLMVSEYLTLWELQGYQHASCFIQLPRDVSEVPAPLQDIATNTGLSYKTRFYFECDNIVLEPGHPLAQGQKRTLYAYGWIGADTPTNTVAGKTYGRTFELYLDFYTWRGDMGVKSISMFYKGYFDRNSKNKWNFIKQNGSSLEQTTFFLTTFDPPN